MKSYTYQDTVSLVRIDKDQLESGGKTIYVRYDSNYMKVNIDTRVM